MSFNTVATAANDPNLMRRVEACIRSEAVNNPTLKDTQFAAQVRQGVVGFQSMYWAVGSAVEGEYESGVLAGRGSPGHDADVVTDGAILSAVQVNWPPDPVVTP